MKWFWITLAAPFAFVGFGVDWLFDALDSQIEEAVEFWKGVFKR